MSLITTHSSRTFKSAHTMRTALGLVLLPIVLLAAAAYGSVPLHAVAHELRVALRTLGVGGSHLPDAPLDVAFAAIVAIIAVAVMVTMRERHSEQQHGLHDVR